MQRRWLFLAVLATAVLFPRIAEAHDGAVPTPEPVSIVFADDPTIEGEGGRGGGCWNLTFQHDSQDSLGGSVTFYNRLGWCGNGSTITSVWQNDTWADATWFCFPMAGPYTYLNSGGVGAWYMGFRTQGTYGCKAPFIDFTAQHALWFEPWVTAWGTLNSWHHH